MLPEFVELGVLAEFTLHVVVSFAQKNDDVITRSCYTGVHSFLAVV